MHTQTPKDQDKGSSLTRFAAEQIDRLRRLANDKESELTRKNSELRAIVCASPVAIVLADAAGKVQEWNPAAEKMLGYTRGEVLAKPAEMFVHQARRRDLDECLHRGEHFNAVELRLNRKDGSRVFVSASGAPVLDNGHEPSGHIWVLLDITERKLAEETLRKSEKLASAGRMAAVIAHEINNPLEAITNLLYLIGSEKLSDQTRTFLNMAESELKRVVHIARQTLGFYREANKPQVLKIADVFNQVADVYALRMRKRNVALDREIEFDGEVVAFPGEMRQLFTNLLSNSIEAEATRLRMRVSQYREWKHPFRWGTLLTFADNGKGIPPEAMHSIFEPFFTTKGEKGTGLGLWVSRGVVEKYEGSIRVRSAIFGPRNGTSFAIFFPAPAERKHVVPITDGQKQQSDDERKAA
jgi:PAS domain S-box-containing protein